MTDASSPSNGPSQLVRCTRCNAHLKRSDTERGACIFCGTSTRGGGIRKLLSRGRSSVLAASLFGVTGLQGCEGDPPKPGSDASTVEVVAPPDASSDSLQEIGPEDAKHASETTVGDTSQPPDHGASDASTTDGTTQPDFVPLPPYGIPPDEPDPGPDASSVDAAAAESDADAGDASDTSDSAPVPMPVYGLPP